MSLRWIADHFQIIQVLIVVFVIGFGVISFRDRGRGSQFKVREADRADLDRIKSGPSIADAKFATAAKKSPPLSLPGIRLDGLPHEILGVEPDADEVEVMRAYKEAIKRYHPDRIQGQAKDQLKFYQDASAKLNDAKELMIKKLRG